MPRNSPPVPTALEVHSEPDALVASSMAYPGRSSGKRRIPTKRPWQREAWALYDLVGELHYSANWIASVCSRALLVAGVRDESGVVRRAEATSAEFSTLEELFGGQRGQGQMLRAVALHLFVAGECYIVGRARVEEDGGDMKDDVWEVVGTEEIEVEGETWTVKYHGRAPIRLAEDDMVFRVWQPHPRDRQLADSPVRAVLPVLREIRFFDKHIESQSRSRLTGNGILWAPSGISFAGTDGTPQSSADALTEVLGAQMLAGGSVDAGAGVEMACYGDRDGGDAEQQVPIVIVAPGDEIAKAKHMTFWSSLDEKALEMRAGAVKRFAVGVDLPQEVVMGTGDMNRWGAWQVEESSVKAHIEPLLDVIVTFLSVDYLQKATGNVRALVMHDTTALRLRPNRSKEALELYDRGILNADTTRRETGFSPDDAPDDDELRTWILHQMVKASWSPDQAQAAAKSLGVDLGIPMPGDNEGRQARPTPSLVDHPVREIPEGESTPEDAIAAAGAMLAWRNMQRAGNRLRTKTGHRPENVLQENTHVAIKPYADKIDDLLVGAMDCPEGIQLGSRATAAIAAHCRGLLERREPFSFDAAREAIREAL